MNTEDWDFLRAIGTAPQDDTPRLIYADWLDEHGQPERAEFIRLQCEFARRVRSEPAGWLLQGMRAVYEQNRSRRQPTYLWLAQMMVRGVEEPAWWEAAYELVSRMTALQDANAERWTTVLPAVPGARLVGPFERGFLTGLEVGPGYPDRAADARALFEVAPVDHLTIRGRAKSRRLLGHPDAARIVRLCLMDNPPGCVTAAADAGCWEQLNEVSVSAERPLSRSPVPELARLHAPRLSALDLVGVSLVADEAEPVADWIGQRRWREFTWCCARLAPRALTKLLQALRFQPGAFAAFGDAGIGPAGAQAIADTPAMADLRFLDLTDNEITRVGREALLGSAHLRRCTVHVGWNGREWQKDPESE